MRSSILIILISLLVGCSSLSQPPQSLPAIQHLAKTKLLVDRTEDRTYLGITHTNKYCTLEDIDTDILVVEILSMYCPLCQKDAPETKKLFEKIAEKGLADRVKMIGIAINNTSFEATLFKKKYTIPFPITPDPDAYNSHALGSRGTPHFIILKKDAGAYSTLYSKQSRIKNSASLLSIVEANIT